MSDKIKKITVWIENKGRGKVSFADSFISVQNFPATNEEGKKAIGVNAIKVEMPEDHVKAFEGMIKVRYPFQLNVLSAEEYKSIKDGKTESPSAVKPNNDELVEKQLYDAANDELVEKQLYDAAMVGGDNAIMAYFEAYPEGKYIVDIQERSAFLDAKSKNTKKSFNAYLKEYPQGRYISEVKQSLGIS